MYRMDHKVYHVYRVYMLDRRIIDRHIASTYYTDTVSRTSHYRSYDREQIPPIRYRTQSLVSLAVRQSMRPSGSSLALLGQG